MLFTVRSVYPRCRCVHTKFLLLLLFLLSLLSRHGAHCLFKLDFRINRIETKVSLLAYNFVNSIELFTLRSSLNASNNKQEWRFCVFKHLKWCILFVFRGARTKWLKCWKINFRKKVSDISNVDHLWINLEATNLHK